MLHYILQTIAFQLVFLLIYDLFLKRETFFNWNRFYLLITSIGSVVLPFIRFESIKTMVPQEFVIRLPEVIIGNLQPAIPANTAELQTQTIANSHIMWNWDYLLYAGMILAFLLLVYKIIRINNLIKKNPKRWTGNLVIVNVLQSKSAFSFFNYIFLGEWIKADEKETILNHELVHVTQKHSLDLFLFELLRILFWFNPLIYIYQNRMTTLHEYIADAKVMQQGNKKNYYEKLLSQVFDTEHISFTNTFFKQSLIKKRIVMLSKSKSNRIHLFKYALLIPMVFGMLAYTSSYAQIKTSEKSMVNQELTFQQLTDTYYKEIKEMVKNGATMRDIQLEYDMSNDKTAKEKYIKSIDEIARIKAYNKYSAEEFIRSEKKKGTFTEKEQEMVDGILNQYKTYEDYLAYQKTPEAKSDWESDIKDGVLRLVVDDIKNLNETEKKKQDEKMALIEKDDFFHALLMTDGKTSTIIEFHSKDGKMIPNPKTNNDDEETQSPDIEVPFSVIDEVPTLESCKDLATRDEKGQCLSDFIAEQVGKNFNTKLANDLGLTGKQRILVLFKIGKDGTIQDIKARAAHPKLEEEAVRVIKLLPQFIPGKQRGKAVIVPYALPIVFQVNAHSTQIQTNYETPSGVSNAAKEEIPFSEVDEVPTLETCNAVATQDEKRQCLTDYITTFVGKNFDIKLANGLGLKGKQRIMVLFKIDKDGTIQDVKARAPHPALKDEAIRVVKLLPQMIPGKQQGKVVAVSYMLPIVFQVNE